MATRTVLIFIAFASLAIASEVEDSEQKKRGAGKTTALNAIPTGAQKPEYTYNIYQTPSSQTSQPSQTYHGQVPNSFYPSQGGNQYYTSNTPTETQVHHPAQPQINLIPPSQSQFVPLNFVPSPGYQSKYQLVPSKSNGNLQLAIIQQPPNFPSLSYPQTLFSPNPNNQISPQSNPLLNSVVPQGHFNFAPNYQPLPLGGYLGQPSGMVLVPQASSSLYNSLLYPNPTQNFYNYYPSSSQPKYTPYAQVSSNEYDKLQGSVAQSAPKEDNDISVQSNEYIASSDSNNAYKNAYATSRSTTYSKLK